MALNAEVLGALIQSKVAEATGNPVIGPAQVVWNAIASAIVEHITSAATVVVAQIAEAPANLSGTSIPGGIPVSGPGTGIIE